MVTDRMLRSCPAGYLRSSRLFVSVRKAQTSRFSACFNEVFAASRIAGWARTPLRGKAATETQGLLDRANRMAGCIECFSQAGHAVITSFVLPQKPNHFFGKAHAATGRIQRQEAVF